ncbi:MAG TPA: double-strand break repair protein AddB [Caulobacteraceae bacterium]|jgi:ATP-dependent helicase/nuclease subunit B|nr:double-strand break repair protein AddB [Caulobacteraceae bacterium]
MNPFDQPAPRWFTVQPHRPFLADLAEGLITALSPAGPQALSDAIVLVPSRRAARGLAEAFVEVGGGRAILLPQIRALGDLDEGEPPFEPGDIALDLPPSISPWRRRFELARLVAENAHLVRRSLDATAALELADALGRFLNGVDIDEAWPLAPPADWVAAEMARHWQVSAEFLALAVSAWPRRLGELGLVDTAARRVALTRALAEQWTIAPPQGVLVAAGSTGSTPATAALLSAVADAPRGLIILPGLDQDLAEPAWAEVGDQHPQGAMKRLLAQAGVERGAVRPWSPARPGDARGRWRRRIVNEALRPAEATADWLEQIEALKAEAAGDRLDPIAEGLAGLSLITARNEEEAAQVAALALREVLETPGRTAALVTPDAGLARRVSARLARWGIEVDSSAGQALAGFPVGQFTALIARQAADPLDPVGLLAILKHPLARLGAGGEALERWALRGARPRDWADIAARLAEAAKHGRAGIEDAARLATLVRAVLETAAAPYTGETATPAEAARALAEAMEALAAGPGFTDPGSLWAGAAGECAGDLIAALIGESDGLPEVTPRQFADLVESLLAAETVRPGGAAHPRLRLLGVLEARLIHADRLILGGLEEGVWPQAAPIDPFLSRPMREAQGLSSPERRIGLSAHDFAQGCGAGEVILLTTSRRGGAPATPSRWLWRLQTLARGARVEISARPDLVAWARALDAPERPAPAPRPKPTPPVAARPREMAVTTVERWVRDPYAVYARDILRLRPLERPAEPVEARARGSAVHKAFERFAVEQDGELTPETEAVFAEMLVEELGNAGMLRPRLARERALAARAAPWVIAFERRRREGARLLIEQRGAWPLQAAGGAFTLTARADRIEQRGSHADVLDFKTGQPPSPRQVKSGLSPQLTLTAALLHLGGFAELGPIEPGQLVYVRILGARLGGAEEVRAERGESLDLALDALDGLRRRIDSFDDPATPYLSWAAPQFISQFEGDYDHLARLWEWHVIGEEEAGQ